MHACVVLLAVLAQASRPHEVEAGTPTLWATIEGEPHYAEYVAWRGLGARGISRLVRDEQWCQEVASPKLHWMRGDHGQVRGARGLCLLADGRVYVSNEVTGAVKLYRRGEFVKTFFVTRPEPESELLWGNVGRALWVRAQADRVYVANADALWCLDEEGRVLWRLQADVGRLVTNSASHPGSFRLDPAHAIRSGLRRGATVLMGLGPAPGARGRAGVLVGVRNRHEYALRTHPDGRVSYVPSVYADGAGNFYRPGKYVKGRGYVVEVLSADGDLVRVFDGGSGLHEAADPVEGFWTRSVVWDTAKDEVKRRELYKYSPQGQVLVHIPDLPVDTHVETLPGAFWLDEAGHLYTYTLDHDTYDLHIWRWSFPK